MTDHRFASRTFTNSNSTYNSMSNNRPERNHSCALVDEDWDAEIEDANPKPSLPRFDRIENQSVRAFQDQTRSFSNFDRNNGGYAHEGNSQDYLIDSNDVPRLIGKGGATIKQLQRDNNAQIKVSNDRQSQWVDLVISGANDQIINNTFNQIKQLRVSIKDKSESFSSKPSFSSGFTTNNTFSQSSNGFLSSTYRLNDSNTLSSRGRGYTNSSNTYDNSSSRSNFNKRSNRRFDPAGNEDDDEYNNMFGSDEETLDNREKPNFASAFPSTTSLWNTNTFDPTKRVDWTKMRQVDTVNDMTKWKDFPSVIKDFYHELPDIAQMLPEDVEALRAEKNNIVVSWFDTSAKDEYEKKNNCKLAIPNPIYEFAHAFHNYPEIMNEIAKQGFTEPSPIQCQAWPVALQGQDFIGIAQTGTGKTLAFLLPALIHIDNQPPAKIKYQGPKALILSPTRELAIQIHQEVQKYSYRGIRSAVIYGGSSRKNQIHQCETGVEIIIATPGRLNDLVMSNVIDLRSVTFLVLDEADRMLDMGFEPQIVKILLDIRPDRQTIMTSATWPEEVRRIAARYMRNPIQIYIGTLDLAAVHSVRQDIEIVKEEEKFDMLLDFIGRMDAEDKAIVFVDRKSSADAIASELIRKHISCQSIHGDREQSDREQALEDLKLGTVNILVATDVASRGLDIQDITVVFNYDLPKSMEDYVHRVGRTGRAGYAISLVTRENWGSAGRLIKILEEAGQNVPGELRTMAERFKAVQDKKREFGSGRNRYGNGGEGRFFGLGSINPRGGSNARDRPQLPAMNSGWSFSS
ncbi:unnamed protein product [Adineta ricciae]|uniref:RNA helicase n=1 Tax=Adineta ricciae TaxID=249248 RepID=A0A814C8N8_ADIRI|nr:unnamed protein product [Adineta ricciae]